MKTDETQGKYKTKKKSLLLDEYPLLVLPALAKAIGLNEAIALQQLHYWLENPKGGVMLDGERWVYNTYEDWQKDNFPFWSVSTIQRTFANLEKMELVISKQKAEYDRKKYYRIHHVNLTRWNMPDWNDAEYQDGMIDHAKVASSLTETTTETTEKEIDSQIFTALENLTGGLNSNTPKFVDAWKERHTPVRILEAIALAKTKGRKPVQYVDEILIGWEANGYPKTREERVSEKRGNGNGKHPPPPVNVTDRNQELARKSLERNLYGNRNR